MFVDAIDLAALGFEAVNRAAGGRPAYHPATLLTIYIYGYLNRIQSSRRLEREAQRNLGASDGRYCRTFMLAPPYSMAGLACRDAAGWHVSALGEATRDGGELRLASTALPPAVLAEVDARLEDDPLDADAEPAARDAGWR